MPDSAVFDLAALCAGRAGSGRPYFEFLRLPAMSAGLYELAAGAADTQQPHREAEIYYVIAGRADFRAGSGITAVKSGSVIFVEAGIEHRFEQIAEDLRLLVFFAPAETT